MFTVVKCNYALSPADPEWQVPIKTFHTRRTAEKFAKMYSKHNKCITTVVEGK